MKSGVIIELDVLWITGRKKSLMKFLEDLPKGWTPVKNVG
jgi:hypothetical protein